MHNRKLRKAERLILRLAALLGIPVQIKANAIGDRFQVAFAKKCESLGHQVLDVSGNQLPCDLIVNGHRVQCKARATRKGPKHNEIRLKHRQACRYRVSDVDFFAIRHKKCVYVVPSTFLADESGDVATWVDARKIVQFRDAYGQLEGSRVRFEQQKRFDF